GAVIAIQHIGVVGKVSLEYVKLAVQVVVPNRDSHSSLLRSIRAEGYAFLRAILAKRPVMFVAKEKAGSGIGSHVDICPAVVAEVRGDTGHGIGVLCFGDSAFLGYIAESPVALIAV